MNLYLAKSNPKQNIQQHTDELIKNYKILKKTYPNLDLNWDMLYLACLYHDLGKMNKKFQEKITVRRKSEDEIPHGILSLAFISPKELKAKGYTTEDITILAHSIGYHHERTFNYTDEMLDIEIDLLKSEVKGFCYDKCIDLEIRRLSSRFFEKNERIHQIQHGEEMFFNYVKIKGLLNRLDYAASGGIEVEKPNDFLLNSMEMLMKNWLKQRANSDWNDLQKHLLKHTDNNVVAIAETGMGKTEAGLLWIGNNKGFFTLPLKTAINAMYERVATTIIKEDIDNRVCLLHSDTYSEYLNRNLDDEIDIDEYYNKTKQLSLPLTICTLDQIFDFVYRYRGFEPKLATLSYSKVVIDEVQMYSSDLLAYLILGLYYITRIGGKFAILTATLPTLVLDLLEDEGIDFIPPKTFINKERIRHSIKMVHKNIDAAEVYRRYNKNKVLVICNTVKEAQRIYKELRDVYSTENLNLFHSNFIKKDRKRKEEKILSIGNKDSQEYGIWVTTQVVEASLDIDFDILFTELSDLNGLFQRLGRCYRGRSYEKSGYNCYVFDGGEKKCSGVGYVIDKDIFQMSKIALQSIEGPIDEDTKMELVSNLYTTDKLMNTDYYQGIKNNLEYVKRIEEHELEKKDVRERFRNIETKSVIPKEVYNINKDEIHSYINILLEEYNQANSVSELTEKRKRKVSARINLMNYTVSVPNYKIRGNIIENLIISKYETIAVFNCTYTDELGVEYLENNSCNEEEGCNNFF